MADNKHVKPSAENAVSTDSGELFQTLVREELFALKHGQLKKLHARQMQ